MRESFGQLYCLSFGALAHGTDEEKTVIPRRSRGTFARQSQSHHFRRLVSGLGAILGFDEIERCTVVRRATQSETLTADAPANGRRCGVRQPQAHELQSPAPSLRMLNP